MVLIGFSTQLRNPISRLIRWFTKSRASHAWLLVYDPVFDMQMVMEAHEAGFRFVPFKRFQRENDVVAVYAPDHDLDVGLREAANWLGYKFDFLGLVGTLWVLLGRNLKMRRWRNPFTSTRSLFCSEAVVRILTKSGYPGADGLEPEDTTPQDLMDFLAKRGARRCTEDALDAMDPKKLQPLMVAQRAA